MIRSERIYGDVTVKFSCGCYITFDVELGYDYITDTSTFEVTNVEFELCNKHNKIQIKREIEKNSLDILAEIAIMKNVTIDKLLEEDEVEINEDIEDFISEI